MKRAIGSAARLAAVPLALVLILPAMAGKPDPPGLASQPGLTSQLPMRQFFDLDDNLVPEGWTQEIKFDGPGIRDEAFRGYVTDGRAWLRQAGTLPAGAVGVRLEYDGNLEYSYWGMSTSSGVVLSSGAEYKFSCGMASHNYGRVTRVRIDRSWPDKPSEKILHESHPFESGTYHFEVVFSQGLMSFRATRKSDGDTIFSVVLREESFAPAELAGVFFHVKSRTESDAWMDNLLVEVLEEPEGR